MSTTTELNTRIKHIINTSEIWQEINPTLLNGELGFVETADRRIKIKIGDGNTEYNNLPFINMGQFNVPIIVTSSIELLAENFNSLLFCGNTDTITVTMPAVADVEAGWSCFIQVGEGAGIVEINAVDEIRYFNVAQTGAFKLGSPNFVQFITDGTAWHVIPYMIQSIEDETTA